MTTQRLFTHLLAIFVITVWGVTFVSTKLLLEAGASGLAFGFLKESCQYPFLPLCLGLYRYLAGSASPTTLCQKPQGRVMLCSHGCIWRIYVLLYGELGLGIYLDQQCLPDRMYESAANCYHRTFPL